jgi:hypothetical protein
VSKKLRQNNVEEKPQVSPQRMSWKNHRTFNSYPEANSERIKLLETQKNVKVRRTGDGGTKFTVKVGTPIKNKKGEKNATK